jgi:UDP-N-acetylmuramyl pentapeptide phosphotransferase/UDP-N-acetylglucosamine-1-phosphate transferase
MPTGAHRRHIRRVSVAVQAELLHFKRSIVPYRATYSQEKTVDISRIGGLIILIADVYAIVMILQSSARNIEKLIWTLVVLLLPLVGLVIWFLVGPGKKPF